MNAVMVALFALFMHSVARYGNMPEFMGMRPLGTMPLYKRYALALVFWFYQTLSLLGDPGKRRQFHRMCALFCLVSLTASDAILQAGIMAARWNVPYICALLCGAFVFSFIMVIIGMGMAFFAQSARELYRILQT